MFTLIDTHTHFGQYGEWDCPLPTLIALMDAYHIDKAVIGWMPSNALGAAGFEEALRLIRGHEDRLRLMLWVNPAVKDDVETAERMLQRYENQIACMKAHPETAQVPLGDPRYEPYLRLCHAYGLTFVSHTEPGCYSSMDSLAVMAKKHPEVSFIAVHMELRGDHAHAMRLIAEHPNLFGDTTFLPAADVRAAVNRCGADKVVFGSDAPILSDRYGARIAGIRSVLSPEEEHKVFHTNAFCLFHLGA